MKKIIRVLAYAATQSSKPSIYALKVDPTMLPLIYNLRVGKLQFQCADNNQQIRFVKTTSVIFCKYFNAILRMICN